jgi:hypothetical protein
VSTEEVQALLRQLRPEALISYLECSARTGEGIQSVLTTVTRDMMEFIWDDYSEISRMPTSPTYPNDGSAILALYKKSPKKLQGHQHINLTYKSADDDCDCGCDLWTAFVTMFEPDYECSRRRSVPGVNKQRLTRPYVEQLQ